MYIVYYGYYLAINMLIFVYCILILYTYLHIHIHMYIELLEASIHARMYAHVLYLEN